jgi:hypothetical protein
MRPAHAPSTQIGNVVGLSLRTRPAEDLPPCQTLLRGYTIPQVEVHSDLEIWTSEKREEEGFNRTLPRAKCSSARSSTNSLSVRSSKYRGFNVLTHPLLACIFTSIWSVP